MNAETDKEERSVGEVGERIAPSVDIEFMDPQYILGKGEAELEIEFDRPIVHL